MQNYILFSDIDQAIIDRSANQVPDISKRIRAVNTELDALAAEFDIFDGVREKSLSIITDGSTAYDLSTLVPDNDVKSIKHFEYGNEDNIGRSHFDQVDYQDFIRKYNGTSRGNYYTIYVKDGVQYLNVLTDSPSEDAETLYMTYYTTFKALDDDNDFIPSVVNAVGVKILLHARFKELVAIGALKKLFYPAIGEDSLKYLNELKSEYNELKNSLGLTSAKATRKPQNRIRLHVQW